MSGFYEVTAASVDRRRETDLHEGTDRPANRRVIPPPPTTCRAHQTAPPWFSAALALRAHSTENQTSNTDNPTGKPDATQPTQVNSNHFAAVGGGRMSLDGVEYRCV
jgi:hypothetical protein